MPNAIVGEGCDFAIVAFQRIEVGIGGISEDLAGGALGSGNISDRDAEW